MGFLKAFYENLKMSKMSTSVSVSFQLQIGDMGNNLVVFEYHPFGHYLKHKKELGPILSDN